MEPKQTPRHLADLSRTQQISFNTMKEFTDRWGTSVQLKRLRGLDTSGKYLIMVEEVPTDQTLSHPQVVGWTRIGWAVVEHLGQGVFQLDFTEPAINLLDEVS